LAPSPFGRGGTHDVPPPRNGERDRGEDPSGERNPSSARDIMLWLALFWCAESPLESLVSARGSPSPPHARPDVRVGASTPPSDNANIWAGVRWRRGSTGR